ncbi:YifB family Mg chelatase-like AAA ATPase [Corynebacterium sp. YIM 101645]|uniref:YifB family Mg chelatase-like AAA ATPase n=1 Tax=Corynebacterium lemuris TaxID=1859292 RepID=A0ABT2FZ87_9CORY|nr:YifB family Mg chelatase-like AAA ATPase [Corynebacterium lemuris]MCS5479254.1 YifB family Mg chelatase-like AAA ATPase [Corynebacterium lemuris]
MALGRSHTVALEGVTARIVTVEANIGPGLPGIHMVGLGDAAVIESRDRIRTAVANSQLSWPKTKIVVSMSPASLRKSGSHFDLPTALALLAAGATPHRNRLEQTVFVGELGLDGTVRPVPGVLPALLAARTHGFSHAVIPPGNAQEATLVEGLTVHTADTLVQAWHWTTGEGELPAATGAVPATQRRIPDFADLAGQPRARLAAEVAAAGGHHMLLIGPPGSGKSMIAARLPGILPPLSPAQALEATAVHSVAGRGQVMTQAPFIDPHHSISRAALLGGGSGLPRPGAVSLAHHGVLFLDEVSEVPAAILDGLRTPLEDGQVRLIRSRREVVFPARFQLILAANPCRCAAEDPARCRCTSRQRTSYLNNLSGPLRDRLDIVAATSATGAVLDAGDAEPSSRIAGRVHLARERAQHRWGMSNSMMDPHELRRHHPADEAGMAMLGTLLAEGELTQRGVDRCLKLAWTLTDLEGAGSPDLGHVARALDLREGA